MSDISALIADIEKTDGRRWCFLDNYHLKVYLRVSRRYVNRQNRPTICIATVEVDEEYRHDGHFTRFLEQIEQTAQDKGYVVFIENILDDRFFMFFIRRGYLPHELPGCVFKLAAK